VVGGEDEHGGTVGRAETAGGGDAVHAGHLDVADDDVHLRPGRLEGVGAVRAFGDDVDVLEAVEDGAQTGADDGVGVNEHDTDHGSAFAEVRDIETSTVVPSPVRTSRSPWTAAMRASRPRSPYPYSSSKPPPSSTTSSVTVSSHTAKVTTAIPARACRTTF